MYPHTNRNRTLTDELRGFDPAGPGVKFGDAPSSELQAVRSMALDFIISNFHTVCAHLRCAWPQHGRNTCSGCNFTELTKDHGDCDHLGVLTHILAWREWSTCLLVNLTIVHESRPNKSWLRIAGEPHSSCQNYISDPKWIQIGCLFYTED